MSDTTNTSVNMRIELARTIEEVVNLRDFYEKTQRHPEADIDWFLTAINGSKGAATPYLLILHKENVPSAMLVGYIADTVFKFKLGYRVLGERRVRQLKIINGGALGDLSYSNCVALCREITVCLARGDADVALLPPMQPASDFSRVAAILPGILCRDHLPSTDENWTIALPPRFDTFKKRLSENARSSIRQHANRLRKKFGEGLQVKCFDEAGDVDVVMNDIEAIARRTYQRGIGVGFHCNGETRRNWVLAAQRQWLRAFILYLDGEPCAFWTGYVYKRVFYIGQTGYDPRLREYGPGTFLLMHLIEYLCEHSDVDRFDLGFGTADYKKRYGTECVRKTSVYIFAPTIRGVGLNAAHTIALGLTNVSRNALERLGILRWLKTKWRRHISVALQSQRSDQVKSEHIL